MAIRRLSAALKSVTKGDSISMRSARASLWLTLGIGVQEVLRVVRNIVLVRVIAPEAFGVMAIVLAVYQLFEATADMGIREAIVQNPEGTKDTFVFAAWLVSLVRSTVLYGVAFIAAPIAATVYHSTDLVPFIRWVSICALFRGAVNTSVYVLTKRMKFARYIAVFNGGTVIGIIVTIILGVLLRTTWALVYGAIAEAAAICLLSFAVSTWPRGSVQSSRRNIREVLSFSKGYVGLPILNFLFNKTDVFVLGKLLSATEMGLYSVITGPSSLMSSVVSRVVGPVFMPAYTELLEKKKDLTQAVLYSTTALATVSVPLVAFVWTSAKSLIGWIYTLDYAQMWLPFLLLFGADSLRTVNAPVTAAYLSMGKPSYLRTVSLVRCLVLLALIYPLSLFFGVCGAASAVLVSCLIWHGLQILKLRQILGVKLVAYLRCFGRSFIGAAPIIAYGYACKIFAPNCEGLLVGGSGLLLILVYAFSLRSIIHGRDRREVNS